MLLVYVHLEHRPVYRRFLILLCLDLNARIQVQI